MHSTARVLSAFESLEFSKTLTSGDLDENPSGDRLRAYLKSKLSHNSYLSSSESAERRNVPTRLAVWPVARSFGDRSGASGETYPGAICPGPRIISLDSPKSASAAAWRGVITVGAVLNSRSWSSLAGCRTLPAHKFESAAVCFGSLSIELVGIDLSMELGEIHCVANTFESVRG